ncbi:MAG: hypothetical protein WBH44_03835 [Proteocatella sp.]
MVAIRDIKSNLSSILKDQILNEDDILTCERFFDMKIKLPFKENDDLAFISQWTNEKIEKVILKTNGYLSSYSYKGIELFKFNDLIDNIRNRNIDYNNYLLPPEDNFSGTHGWVWGFYSRNQILKRIELFFHYYQTSFVNLVENNFDNVKMYLPDYIHLPYKYIIEVVFKDESITDMSSEPLLCYYYIACDSNENYYPMVNVVENISDWNYHNDVIKKSFKNKSRFTHSYSVRETGVTLTIHDRKTGSNLPIVSNVYELIQSNLERIFGKF